MNLLGSNKSKISKDKNGKNVPDLKNNEVVLVYCNIVNKDCQQSSRVLYRFIRNKSFGQLLNISPANFIFLKISYWEFRILKYGLLIKIMKR